MEHKQTTDRNMHIKRSHKYSYVLIVIVLLLLAIVVLDKYVIHSDIAAKPKLNSIKVAAKPKSNVVAADPYRGWKTYCSQAILACIRYPPGWTEISGLQGTFIDPTSTTEVSLIPLVQQNNIPNLAYIYSLSSIMTSPTSLDVAGYIVSDQPGYVVYDASYVVSKGIRAGSSQSIIDGNYAFNAKQGTASLVATPYENGYASIDTLSQAEAWFNSPNGITDLMIIKSLYYQ